ncbi:MAG: phosphatase PAP2 family protein [Candidatus Tectimicrobiota bacterium]
MSAASLPWHSKLCSRVMASDLITAGYLTTIGLLATLFAERLPQWWCYPLAHALFLLALGMFLIKLPDEPPGWALFIRWWYPALLIPPIFSELQFLVHPINPVDLDAQLTAIDFALFGVHPTVWLEHWMRPWLTEYLQLAYMTFYFLPFILCAPLYRQGCWQAFRTSLCALLLGYYVSYLLYFLTPARGPRFYLAAYQQQPLTGLWLTRPLQDVLDHLEGIQRDAFPSGHTTIALIVMVMALRHQHRLRYPLVLITTSLLFSTVYLRYHYVIDVIAGIVLALWCLGVAFWLHREPKEAYTAFFTSVQSSK